MVKKSGRVFPILPAKYNAFSTIAMPSKDEKTKLVTSNFAILVNLDESKDFGGKIKRVYLDETTETYIWNNGAWIVGKGINPRQSVEPLDLAKPGLIRRVANISVGTQKGKNSRTLFIGDQPAIEMPADGIMQRKVFGTYYLEDEERNIRTIKVNFIIGVDPKDRLPFIKVSPVLFENNFKLPASEYPSNPSKPGM